MRILEIRFKNIHSLKGVQHINFEEQPLKAAGIFAIVGPTGSGKSTILDVITLALYNQIPRIKSKLSKNMIDKLGSIVTHHTNEAWAEVDYQSNKGIYTSRWSIAKTRNNTWQDYDMSIVDLQTNKALPFKKGEVPLGNEELIGLNYEQFIKSILLSQGQFSVFLKAKKNERSKLLEDISGHDIYRQIGSKVYEVCKEKQIEIDKYRSVIQSIQLMEEDERTLFQNQVKDAEEELKSIDKELLNYRKSLQILSLQNEIKQETKEIANLEEHYLQQMERSKSDKEAYTKHLQVVKYQGDFLQRSSVIKQLEELGYNIERTKQKITINQKALNDGLLQVKKLIQQDVNLSNYKEALTEYESKIMRFDQELLNLKNNGNSTRQRISKGIRLQDSPLASFLIKKDTSADQAIQQITQRILEIKPKEKAALEDLREEQKRKQADLHTAQQLSNLMPRAEKKATSILEDKKKHDELENMLVEAKKSLDKLAQEVEKCESKSEALRRKKDSVLRNASLEQHRSKLEEDQPCPLCGSLDHPFVAHQTVFNVGRVEIQLQEALTKEKTIKKKYNELENKNIQASTALENLKQQIQRQIEEESQERRQIQELIGKGQTITFSNDMNMAHIHSSLTKELSALETMIQHFEEYRILTRLQDEFVELKELTVRYRILAEERKTHYQGADIQGDVQKLEIGIQTSLLNLRQDEKVLETHEASRVQSTATLQEVNVKLMLVMQELGYEQIEEAQSHILLDSRQQQIELELKKIEKQRIEIGARKAQLEKRKNELKEVPAISQTIEELNLMIAEKDQIRKELLKNIGKITEMLRSDTNRRKESKDKRKQLEEMEQSFEKYSLMNSLIGDKTGNTYSNFAQELTLFHLLELANIRLQSMTDRYRLDYSGEDYLQIIDEHQGGTQRSVQTLSGGETFIVSLALALSLSDLASNKIKLDCLFIDEGFGTLDPDTLDMALSTLEKLQHDSNKSIGIISHVESLKERITTKIILEKSHLGHSSIVVQ